MIALIRILAFGYRSALFAKRNIFSVVEMLFWPTFGMLSIGLMSDFVKLDKNTLNFILTGAIASGVLQIMTIDVAYGLLYDVWSKSIKHTFLAPVQLFEICLGSWLVGLARGTFIFLFLSFGAHKAFGFELAGIFQTAVFISQLGLNGLFLGMWVLSLILAFGQRAEIATWAFSPLIMLTCGMYYPVEILPPILKHIAQWLPLTHALEYWRSHYGFDALNHHPNAGFILSGFYIALSLGLLNLSLKLARQRGTLVKLSE